MSRTRDVVWLIKLDKPYPSTSTLYDRELHQRIPIGRVYYKNSQLFANSNENTVFITEQILWKSCLSSFSFQIHFESSVSFEVLLWLKDLL